MIEISVVVLIKKVRSNRELLVKFYRVAQIKSTIRVADFSFPDQPIPGRFFAMYWPWAAVLFSL
jgi:hypothetical protein